MASNSENTAWNNLHQGCRVPINDTGATGAPAALSSADPSWAYGSLNKAVKATWDANAGAVDVDDQADYDAGILSLKNLGKYIYPEMLYGYIGDAVDTAPGDMMSYRGYPTAIFETEEMLLENPTSSVNWNVDGSVGSISGNFIISKYVATIKYAVGYAINWETYFLPPNHPELGTLYDVKIAPGYKHITHYKVVGDEIWIELPQGAMFFSSSTLGATGDLVIATSSDDLYQPPTYGIPLGITSLVVPDTEYDPTIPPAYYLWTTAYKSPRIWLDCVITGCAEVPESDIKSSPGNTRTMYATSGVPIGLGSRLYKNLAGDVWDEPATYVNAAWAYYYTAGGYNIYSISRIITVDAAGYITYYKLKSSEPHCWESDPCAI